MEDLVFKGSDGQALTSSLLVAEKFEKRHADVLRAIDDLLSKLPSNQCERNFAILETRSIPMPNGGVRDERVMAMTRDGFTLLIMGFTGEKALQFKLEYIEAFNLMEKTLQSSGFKVPSSFSEALMLAAKQAEQIETQQNKLQAQAPKVLFADAVSTSQRSYLIAELAKIIQQNGVDIGQNRLFVWMRENGYLCSKGLYYNQPTQKSMELGLFEIKQTSISKPDGTVLVTTTTKVTGKGQMCFVNKFLGEKELA